MADLSKKTDKIKVPYFEQDTLAWLDGESSGAPEDVWTKVKVLSQSGPRVTVRILKDGTTKKQKAGKPVQVDLRTNHLEPANQTVESDLTALHYMHEAAILENLEKRSYEDEPYTFMGNVLVSVNPLKYNSEPPDALGKVRAAHIVHPYAIAEMAYQQMSFRGNQMRREKEERVSQSIVTSGESGAGKTENAKMLMRHLVYRSGEESSELTVRMLESNTILEAFGNAGTLRNHNSSRFGKFMKLWFAQKEGKIGELPNFQIAGASITTYLLEQSRITLHGYGEHNFHVFYYIINGDSELRDSLSLNNKLQDKESGKFGFRYLDPVQLQQAKPSSKSKRPAPKASVAAELARSRDAANYTNLIIALEEFGITGETLNKVLRILGGILHVGNIIFHQKANTTNDQAEEDTSMYAADYSPLHVAAELLETEMEELSDLLTSRRLMVRGETNVVTLSPKGAEIARDSLARLLYIGLFDWIVRRINLELGGKKGAEYFIGILDIFGFEVFQLNTFEQLLINYANEALQGTFERSVFIHELDLYKREGLLHDNEHSEMEIPDNSHCLELFQGKKVASKGVKKRGKLGILRMIDAESQSIKPSDEKLNASLHRLYDDHECFGRIHPADRKDKFIVVHYAGSVTYTIGSFVKKNRNGFLKPEDMIEVLGKSKNEILTEIMETTGKIFKEAESKHIRPKTVVGKFSDQINDLIQTLEGTSTSFVRCIKPNPSLTRTKNSKNWFNRKYVQAQLTTLSIPQTVQVLSSGYPTRIPYKTLMQKYKDLLPSDAIRMWQKSNNGDTKAFIRALFFAFNVDRKMFKMGYTKVFFKAGQLSALEHVLNSAEKWKSENNSAELQKLGKSFKGFYIRSKWRTSFAIVFAMNRFLRLAKEVHERREAERLERERKERERKARIWRRWKVALIALLTRRTLMRLLEDVREKRRIAEEKRKAELEAKDEAERKKIEEEEKEKAAKEQEKREKEEKAQLVKAESLRVIMNKKIDEEENEEIAKIEAQEKETFAKIEKQLSMRTLPNAATENVLEEEKEEESLANPPIKKTVSQVHRSMKVYDPLGRLNEHWQSSKNRVLRAVGVKTKEQIINEEALAHVEKIQNEREIEQKRLEQQARENLKALNIDFDFDLDDEDFKRARERDAEDAKKLLALERERLKYEALLEEEKARENGTEVDKQTSSRIEEGPDKKIFKRYNWDVFDWEKHVIAEDDVGHDGKPVDKDLVGKTYYYNTKTGITQWTQPDIYVYDDDNVDDEEETEEHKEMVKRAREMAVAEADKSELMGEAREEMIANLEKRYLHALATNKVAMDYIKHEGAISRFFNKFKDTHFFKHSNLSADEQLANAEEKHEKKANRRKRSVGNQSNDHNYHNGANKKSHDHTIDPVNKAVKKVVMLSDEQAENPLLSARQHAEELDKMAEQGKITPMELISLKKGVAESASKGKVDEKIKLKRKKSADKQIHCPSCDTIINTQNGRVCPNCLHELESDLILEPKTVGRTHSDEHLDKEHYEKIKWDMVINSQKGKLKVYVEKTVTDYDEMSARDLTFFQLEIVLEKSKVTSKKDGKVASSFKHWVVLHSFTELFELSVDISSGKLGKDNLKKAVRSLIRPIREDATYNQANPFQDDLELLVNFEPEKYKNMVSRWFQNLGKVLNNKDKKFGRPLFATQTMDEFFEISEHVPDESDIALM